tara:strand:+ start:61 stop:261 length:201 start_codon:yes stop_codon:yes gene_type:complete
MNEEIRKSLEKSLATINKVMSASMNNSEDIEGSLANYGAFIQIKMCVEAHIEMHDLIRSDKERTNG